MSAPIFLVIGGSRGIGAAISLAAGRQKVKVLLTYSTQAERAQSVRRRLKVSVCLSAVGFGLLEVGLRDGAVTKQVLRAAVEFVGERVRVARLQISR